jgi:hypothetical protein
MSTSGDPSQYDFLKMLNLNDPNDLLEYHPNENIPLLEAGAKAAAEATSEAIKANFMVNNANAMSSLVCAIFSPLCLQLSLSSF